MKIGDIDWGPEQEPIDNGDPFLAEIRKADDIISDHTHGAELLCELSGKTPEEAAQVARDVEQSRDEYEITTLNRWLARPSPWLM